MRWLARVLCVASFWTLPVEAQTGAAPAPAVTPPAVSQAGKPKQANPVPTTAQQDGCELRRPKLGQLILEDAQQQEARLASCVQAAQEAKDAADIAAEKKGLGIKDFSELTIAAAEAGRVLVKHQKRLQMAHEWVEQANHELAREAAEQNLKDADACRDRARAQAKEDDVETAGEAVANAQTKTRAAGQVADELGRRREQLRAAIAREEGEREALQRRAGELDTRRAKPGVDEAEKARLDAERKVLQGRIEASVETQALLTDLEKATTETGEQLASEVDDSEEQNGRLTDQKLKRIALKHGDNLSYGVTLAAVRLRVTRDPSQQARLRDYQPEAEFVPSLLGLRIVYEPSAKPWRIDTAGDALQLLSVEFALYLEKAKGNSLESLSAGLGLTFMEGLLGIGLAFDVYRVIGVQGGHAKTGIMPWALSRTGEVTAENVSVMVTLGLESVFSALTGSTDNEDSGESP